MTAREVALEVLQEALNESEKKLLRLRVLAKAALAALVEWEAQTGKSRQNPAELREFHETTYFAYDGVVEKLGETKDRRDALAQAVAFVEQ